MRIVVTGARGLLGAPTAQYCQEMGADVLAVDVVGRGGPNQATSFLNADLTVNFSREPDGDWILLDAESWIGPDGAGLAMARLADARGYFGRAIQSLVIEKR